MQSENTKQRNAMRNSITEITRQIDDSDIKICIENGLSFKRTPTADEVTEYNNKLKDIAQNLYKHNIDNMMDGNAASTQPGIKLIKKYVWQLADEIEALLDGISGKSSLKPILRYCEIAPTKKCTVRSRCEELALITLTHVVNGVTFSNDNEVLNTITGMSKSGTVKQIGRVISDKIFQDAVDQESRITYEIKKAIEAGEPVKKYRPTSRKQLMLDVWGVKKRSHESIDSIEQDRLDIAKRDMGIRFGAQLVKTLLDNFDFVVQVKRKATVGGRFFTNLELSQEHAEEVQAMISQGMSQVSLEMPSITKPREWETARRFNKPLVRNSRYNKYVCGESEKHIAKIDRDLHEREAMPEVYEVLDIIESTEWTIDAEMVEILKECIEKGIEVPGINEVAIIPPKPPSKWSYRLDSDAEEPAFDMETFDKDCLEYREANPKAFEEDVPNTAMIIKWHKAYKNKASNDSKCAAGLRSIETADALKEYKEIFFAHNLDTRGRIYPIATSLNPQLNDVSKGLLKFAEGDVVDEEALGWLEVNIANAWAEEVEIELTDDELMNEIEFIQQFV